MPKVSIIMPVYNVGPYLGEALHSLVNQTMGDIEIIAVNDGSTDDSEAILKQYQEADSRFRYFNQSNQGQSAARNHGMKYATGEYIYFMDSDDVLDHRAMETCYEYSQRNKADFVFFDGDIMLEDGAASPPWDYKRTHLVEEDKPLQGPALLKQMLDSGKHNCVVWLLFIRKSYLDGITLSFYNGIIHEDELFTVLLTLQSRNIFALRQNFVRHRVRQTSTMGTHYSKRNINCYLTVVDELLRFQQSPLMDQYARYTLSIVFYTGHLIPLKEKPGVFWRAMRSGYLKYIGIKPAMAFWLKRRKEKT